MRELKVHNDLIGNRDALEKAWKQDGYWFFRNVLDKEAVARLRKRYTDELERLGVIDPIGDRSTEGSVAYNGASLAEFPRRMDTLWNKGLHESFTSEPPIRKFFSSLLQDEPFWIPIVEYRATAPASEAQRVSKAWATGIHQDGPYSPGIPFRICWFPLAHIDVEMGGLALAEGMCEEVNRHPITEDGSNSYISQDAIPEDRWRRSTYEAGDLLMMNPWTPHTGLHNRGNLFRLSMDHRLTTRSENPPTIGTVKSCTTTAMTFEHDGDETTVSIDGDTYVRYTVGRRLLGEEVSVAYVPGHAVIIGKEGDRATCVRPPSG